MFGSVIRAIAMGVGGLAAASLLWGAPPASASVSTDRASATVAPRADQLAWCDTRWVITGNGIRIHARPSLAAPALALYYQGDRLQILVGDQGGWTGIIDYTKNVSGWISSQYVSSYAWCD